MREFKVVDNTISLAWNNIATKESLLDAITGGGILGVEDIVGMDDLNIVSVITVDINILDEIKQRILAWDSSAVFN